MTEAAWSPHWLDDVARWPSLLAGALAHARTDFPREACGYLVPDLPGRAHPLRNGDADPRRGFSVDDVGLLRALDRATAQHAEVVLYHSHPGGEARWSSRDAAHWDGVQLWRLDHLVLGLGPGAVAQAVLVRWCRRRARFVETVRGPLEGGATRAA